MTVRRLVVFNYDYGLTINDDIRSSNGELPILRPLSDDSESLILCEPEGNNKEKTQIISKTMGQKSGLNSGINCGINSENFENSEIIISAVENRLKNMLSNIAIKIFGSLQKEMLSCEEARSTGTFPYWLLTASRKSRSKISDDSVSVSGGVLALTKKVQSGRLRKFMGDLCLQVISILIYNIQIIYYYLFVLCRISIVSLWVIYVCR